MQASQEKATLRLANMPVAHAIHKVEQAVRSGTSRDLRSVTRSEKVVVEVLDTVKTGSVFGKVMICICKR